MPSPSIGPKLYWAGTKHFGFISKSKIQHCEKLFIGLVQNNLVNCSKSTYFEPIEGQGIKVEEP